MLGEAEDLPPELQRDLARARRRLRRARARSSRDARRRPAARQARRRLRARGRVCLRSTKRARCATRAAASSPRCRRLTPRRPGVRQLKIKHNNFLGYYIETPQAQGEALLKPPLNATFIHRQTMAGALRFTTNALVDLEAKIASAADRALALELEAFERLRQACLAEGEALARLRRGAGRDRRRRRARRTRGQARLDAARGRRLARLRIEGGRHPVVEAALKAAGEPFVANDCDLSGDARRRRAHRGRHRPEHGGQVDLSAPERADRADRPDGLLRAGGARPYRRRRPAVLARRRGRRSGARPLDLHGRDGRDGGDPQSGDRALAGDPRRDRARHGDLRRPVDRLCLRRAPQRGQPLARPVRHPFPRADPARRDPAAARQPHHAGQRVQGKPRLPARGRARRGRPLLRHPGRQARRPAGLGRQAGAQSARRPRGVAAERRARFAAALFLRAARAAGAVARRTCARRSPRSTPTR